MDPFFVFTVVAVFVSLLLLVSAAASRRATSRVFFTGNRENPWWVAAVAMVGAAMSGVTFVSVPGSVAADGFSYMQMVIGFAIGQVIIAFVFVPLFYRLRVVSLYEYLDSRFGSGVHRTGAGIFFVSKLIGASLRLLAVCIVLRGLLGVSLWVVACSAVALVWLYTRRGGVRAVVWTDLLHTVCLVGAIVVTGWAICRSLGASPWIAAGDARIFFFDDVRSPRYFFKMIVGGALVLVAMTGLDQEMMQRNLSCRSPKDSRINIILSAFTQAVVIFGLLVLGALLYRFAGARGLSLPTRSDEVFGAVAASGLLPRVVGVMFIIGLISSTFSSAGASLTALTTSFSFDFLRLSTAAPESAQRRRRAWIHAGMSVALLVVVLGLAAVADDALINVVFRVAGYTYGPILGLFTFGICTSRRLNRPWAVVFTIIAAPLSAWAIQVLAARVWSYYIGFELIALNAALTFAGLWLVSSGHADREPECS